MKALQVLPVLLSLITVSNTKWPKHVICKDKNVEVSYRSCDPLQDVAFTIDSCTYAVGKTFTMRLGTVLRYSINELYMIILYMLPRRSIQLYSVIVCERNQTQFQFCGKKKGEYIYYSGPVTLNKIMIPWGETGITALFHNEDINIIICVDFYIIKQ